MHHHVRYVLRVSRAIFPTMFFVYVVVEYEGHVLLVRERKHGQRWYAPAGGVEEGETLEEAAVRETLEEAGVRVSPTGLIRVEQRRLEEGRLWMRFVMTARVLGDPRPKGFADEHSLEARWVRPEDVARYPLRHGEVVEMLGLPRVGVPIVAA